MQGSKSEFFQKSQRKQKWDDGTGGKQDNRKFKSGNQKRRQNQKSYE